MNVPEEQLLAAAKIYWKERGFKKVRKRWTKTVGDITYSFYVQGSRWDKQDYYVRPGIVFNALEREPVVDYGHVYKDIAVNTVEQIFGDTQTFFNEWSDKQLIKERVRAFIQWDKRNPLERRRANLVDYEKDPVPADLFLLSDDELDFLAEKW